MIKYIGMAALLLSLAGCGQSRPGLPGQSRDEISGEMMMPQESDQPMLIRSIDIVTSEETYGSDGKGLQ